MEYWKLTRLKLMNIRLLIYLVSIAFFSVSVILATINLRFPLESRSSLTNKVDFHFQMVRKSQEEGQSNVGVKMRASSWAWAWVAAGGGRKLLSGPGSSPPRCISKCGRCTPCRPVHVSVPPGTPVTAEYYPEAWRCKCGNKLYMP